MILIGECTDLQLGSNHLYSRNILFSEDPVNDVHGKAVLIGASSEVETGPYTWSHSGQPVVYQAWYPKEPSSHPSEYCVILRVDGLWNNLLCQIQRQFVCESD